MKKKKLSLKGLEVKSFVTNLDGNLSHTVKGGTVGTGESEAGADTCGSGNTRNRSIKSFCQCNFSEGPYCAENSIAPACPSGIDCEEGRLG